MLKKPPRDTVRESERERERESERETDSEKQILQRYIEKETDTESVWINDIELDMWRECVYMGIMIH